MGADTLRGDPGNDLLSGGRGKDSLDGGNGRDYASYAEKTASVVAVLDHDHSVTVTVGGRAEDTIRNIEHIVGGKAGDTLTVDIGGNILDGRGGRDDLRGDSGNDTLVGGSAADTLTGGGGRDRSVFSVAPGATSAADTIVDFHGNSDRPGVRQGRLHSSHRKVRRRH